MVVEEVEKVVEVVERVATVAEKVSEDVADELPDNTKLKEKVLLAEHVFKVAAKDAKLAEDFIHKVLQWQFIPHLNFFVYFIYILYASFFFFLSFYGVFFSIYCTFD